MSSQSVNRTGLYGFKYLYYEIKKILEIGRRLCESERVIIIFFSLFYTIVVIEQL